MVSDQCNIIKNETNNKQIKSKLNNTKWYKYKFHKLKLYSNLARCNWSADIDAGVSNMRLKTSPALTKNALAKLALF